MSSNQSTNAKDNANVKQRPTSRQKFKKKGHNFTAFVKQTNEKLKKEIQTLKQQVQKLKQQQTTINTNMQQSSHNKNDASLVKELITTQQLQLDMSNQAQFRVPFTGDPKKTLPYIFEMNMFLNTAKIQNESMKFRAIFNTLKSQYKRLFMLDNKDVGKHTIKGLTSWMIKNFKPPISKHEFDFLLKRITIKKAEDPTAVIRRLHYKLDRIDNAIKIINTGIEKPESQLEPFSNEYKANLHAGIFIRKIMILNGIMNIH